MCTIIAQNVHKCKYFSKGSPKMKAPGHQHNVCRWAEGSLIWENGYFRWLTPVMSRAWPTTAATATRAKKVAMSVTDIFRLWPIQRHQK